MTQLKNRKLIRLKNYDYSQFGFYFLTLCTKNRIQYFGTIKDKQLHLTEIGNIAKHYWEEIPKHFPHIFLDEFIIMPEHIHGILVIQNSPPARTNNYWSQQPKGESQTPIPWQTTWSLTISSAIRGFKIGVTKWCRQNNHPGFTWQKSFHDRIIRTETEYINVQQYIINNPRKLVSTLGRICKDQ